jgi:transcriptional regulator with XRE-family HTH domain
MEPITRRFGRRVRELRERVGWSQERFAEECGLHRTYIGGIESLINIERIALALGVGIAELFTTKEGPRTRSRRAR